MLDWLKPVLNRWVMLGAMLMVVILCVFWILLGVLLQPTMTIKEQPPALLTIIAAPTSTQVIKTGLATATATLKATTIVTGGMAVGVYVQISGTGGDGLRLRAGPGMDYKLNIVGMEQEVFRIIEGPAEADGFIWWYLSAPYDNARGGWAVAKYLVVVQQPR